VARLTLEQVQHVARLAALELSDAEGLAMREQLASILDHMASLDAIDVSAVEPSWHFGHAGSTFRADEVQTSGLRDALLAAAPEAEQGAFAVPKVLEADG
jgi:aspartyl-tRNA(Asn)/glutamyl-tRNA(Gln) amidotransferase subunit C